MKKELDVAANPKFYEVMFNDGFSIAIKGIREPKRRSSAGTDSDARRKSKKSPNPM